MEIAIVFPNPFKHGAVQCPFSLALQPFSQRHALYHKTHKAIHFSKNFIKIGQKKKKKS